MKDKILCFLGLHDYKFFGKEEYQISVGLFSYRTYTYTIRKCKCCEKIKSLPPWYDEEYRKENEPYHCGRAGMTRHWDYKVKYPELLKP